MGLLSFLMGGTSRIGRAGMKISGFTGRIRFTDLAVWSSTLCGSRAGGAQEHADHPVLFGPVLFDYSGPVIGSIDRGISVVGWCTVGCWCS